MYAVRASMPKSLFLTQPALAKAAVALVAGAATLLPARANATPPKREVPDYDGRGGERTSPGDGLLWVPRVVFFPAYVVSEYVVRRPLGWLVTNAERARVPQALYDFFVFGEDNNAGWVPTFLVDFGFKPSVGVYFFWNDAFAEGNDVRVQAATWGVHWLAASFTDRIHLNSTDSLTLRFAGVRRPDYEYYGEGARAPEENLSRYSADKLEARGTYDLHLGGPSSLVATAGFRKQRFDDPHDEDDDYRSTLDLARRGVFPLPNEFDTGYEAGFSGLGLRLDSRAPRPASQSGFRFDVGGEQGSDPSGPQLGWVRYGAIAGGFLDLNQRARVLSLSVTASFSDPLTDEPVPFTELVQLGGSEPMRGFVPGRLFGRSAAVATLGYHWPVWIWLDGTIQASVGNVFDAHLQDFEPSLLRFSGTIGVKTAGFSDNPVEMMLGFGTETFEDGARVNALRAVFGTTRGF